jgi:hypothetical protein
MLKSFLRRVLGKGRDAEWQGIRRIDGAFFSMGDIPFESKHEGFPRWDWQAVQDWCDKGDRESQATAWMEAERAWLWSMKEALGNAFTLLESEEALLLSSLPPRQVRVALEFVARARRRILQLLPGIAQVPELGKEILIVLDDLDSYYAYVSHFYPDEGEFAGSSGMYIGMGCGHFVTVKNDMQKIEPVIVHELTHGFVSHLPLPTWLDEGLAVNVEHRLAGGQLSEFRPQELHQMHREFWNPKTIQQFWSGKSFLRTDEGNMLSYDLGRILVGQFSQDMERFRNFALSAKSDDGGRAAAEMHLDMKLGNAVCSLFDLTYSEEWEPPNQPLHHAE